MVERRMELRRRYHRKAKMRKLKAKLAAATNADVRRAAVTTGMGRARAGEVIGGDYLIRFKSSQNPGYVLATHAGLRITTPGTFSPMSAKLIAMR